MLTFFTDTDTDVTLKEANELGIKLISMPYTVDGKDVYPYVDFDEFDSHAFYDTLRNGALPSTSAISEDSYTEYFEPCFKNGEDIVYVHFSAAMTMTFDNMKRAVKKLLEKYPERRFYEADTLGITIISYNIVMEAVGLYKEGKSGEEIVDFVNNERLHFAQYFFADDLRFFKRSGRVSGLAATMGGLVGIRPIITMDENGKMDSIGKVKGRANALDRLVSYVQELGDDIKSHKIIIGHTDSPELVNDLISLLTEKFGELDIKVVPTNPTAGSHCGPNGVGICFHSTRR